MIADFIAYLRSRRNSEGTIESYTRTLHDFETWFKRPLNTMVYRDVRNWVEYLMGQHITRSTIAQKLGALKSLCKFAWRYGLIHEDPARPMKSPKLDQNIPKVPPVGELIPAIEAVTDPLDRAVIEFLYGAGVRVSELTNMDCSDIDQPHPDEVMIRNGKGGKDRVVLHGSFSQAALKTYLNGRNSGPVFLGDDGERLSRFAVVRICRRTLGLHPHQLRHAYGTHMLDAGADLRAIQSLLGHENINSTCRYTAVATSRLKAVYDGAFPRAQ